MGINSRYIEKYNEAYKNLNTMLPFITFDKDSEYYYQEVWMPINKLFVPDVVEHAYEISNYGRIKTHIKSPTYPSGDAIMIPSHNQHGYQQINLRSIYKKNIGCKISRLVMLHFHFVKNCQFYEVDHVNGNKDDNRIWNLEWVTPQENVHRAITNGLRPLSCTSNGLILLTDNEAYELFDKAMSGIPYDCLSEEYKVSEEYIYNLCRGVIRPYIRGLYYDRMHIQMQ